MKSIAKNPQTVGTIPTSLTLFLLFVFLMSFLCKLAGMGTW